MTDSDGLQFTRSRTGQMWAYLTTPWRPEFAEALRSRGVTAMSVDVADGWPEEDVEFLHQVPDLTDLFVSGRRGSRLKIQLSDAPSTLRWLSLCWEKSRVEGLGQCRSLEHLEIRYFPRPDLTDITTLTKLQLLAIRMASPLRTLAGISSLRDLRDLEIYRATQLDSLDGIQALDSLESLVVQTCRQVRSITPLASLRRLRTLNLNNCGEIASLAPVEGLNELRMVQFCESTNILDGDLSMLERLPKLSFLSFQNRRHYSHRREQFRAYTEGPLDEF